MRKKKEELPEPATNVANRRTNVGKWNVRINPLIVRLLDYAIELLAVRPFLASSHCEVSLDQILIYIRISPAVKGFIVPEHHPRPMRMSI